MSTLTSTTEPAHQGATRNLAGDRDPQLFLPPRDRRREEEEMSWRKALILDAIYISSDVCFFF